MKGLSEREFTLVAVTGFVFSNMTLLGGGKKQTDCVTLDMYVNTGFS